MFAVLTESEVHLCFLTATMTGECLVGNEALLLYEEAVPRREVTLSSRPEVRGDTFF